MIRCRGRTEDGHQCSRRFSPKRANQKYCWQHSKKQRGGAPALWKSKSQPRGARPKPPAKAGYALVKYYNVKTGKVEWIQQPDWIVEAEKQQRKKRFW